MEFRQLKYFVCLYDEGSVTRAAQRLNIVQPALSAQIAKLEEEFGLLLFERTPRGMKPTDAGHQAYRDFLPLLSSLLEARRAMIDRGGEISGRVAVGLIASATTTALPSVLRFFTANHPEVEIYVTTGYTQDLVNSVLDRELDFALINQNQKLDSLISTPVVDESLFVVTGIHNRQATGAGPLAFADLAKLNLVLPSRRHGLRILIDQVLAGQGLVLQPKLEIDDLAAIEEFVRSSDWVSILPAITIADGLEAGALQVQSLAEPGIHRHVACVHSYRCPLSPAARLFVDSISQHMQAKIEAAEFYKGHR
uniref:LysR family transcriptional regulator n=1 Tax=Marinobacterium profundum TaxID=1714300 RepID=UPI000837889D|nr:LysR family transcriptional regulator [Marinobacterium profundum]